ncbi:MAG: glycerol kinase [Elusimicrobia bacterium]|nr:glycerol kinase [Elusimicrobiota bacterium]
MKNRQVVIALDQGSSSSRALAFDERGRTAAWAQRPVRTRYPSPGRVEHDAMDLARTLEGALDTALDALPRATEEAALGLSCQRSTVVLWDADSGKPVLPAPSWQDARAAAWLAPLAGDRDLQERVHAKTGLYLNPYYSAPKVRMLLEESAEARRLAASGRLRIGPVSTWVLWRLSKGEVFRADPTMAQRTLLFNLTTGDWDDELLSLFGVPRACLPALGPTAGDFGSFTRRGRTLRVTACIGDQQAAALGQGADEPGAGVLNYGTGAFFLLHTGTRLARVPGLLTSAAWQKAGEPCRYFLEGTVHAAGTSLDWLKTHLGLLDDPRRADAACRRSRRRILALPAIGGLGAPRWDYRTPTVFWGLAQDASKDDIVRGVVEGLAFLIADGVAAARAAGHAPSSFKAGGGLAALDHLVRFQADLLQQPLARLKEREATALGAASLAAEAAGLPWHGALRAQKAGKVFKPTMAAEEARRLHGAWDRFVRAQQELAREIGPL